MDEDKYRQLSLSFPRTRCWYRDVEVQSVQVRDWRHGWSLKSFLYKSKLNVAADGSCDDAGTTRGQ
jgi:hypothetical protein